jgi:hypothetical protein
MPIIVETVASRALAARVREITRDLDPDSRKVGRLRTDIKQVVVLDNIDKLPHHGSTTFAGEDRFGHDLAPPATSTMAQWPENGRGFVLAPRGLSSRTITRFKVVWTRGSSWVLSAGWDLPWMKYHLAGSNHHPLHPNWRLPKRDVGGLGTKAWGPLRAVFARFAKSILK